MSEACYWGVNRTARRLRGGKKWKIHYLQSWQKKVGHADDFFTFPPLQKLPHGPKYGGRGPQNMLKVPLGVGPHAFIPLNHPGTFCTMRAVRQKVGTRFRQPQSLVHDIPKKAKTLTFFGTGLRS